MNLLVGCATLRRPPTDPPRRRLSAGRFCKRLLRSLLCGEPAEAPPRSVVEPSRWRATNAAATAGEERKSVPGRDGDRQRGFKCAWVPPHGAAGGRRSRRRSRRRCQTKRRARAGHRRRRCDGTPAWRPAHTSSPSLVRRTSDDRRDDEPAVTIPSSRTRNPVGSCTRRRSHATTIVPLFVIDTRCERPPVTCA
jgi:hypothetical protein